MNIESYLQTFDELIVLTSPPVSSQQEPQLHALKIGMEYAGGIIFDLDETGQHGLVCAPEDQGDFEWGNLDLFYPYYPDISGDGYLNTQRILEYCDQRPIAASVCANLELNGFCDWYLPSIGELLKVINSLKFNLNTHFGFGVRYWTSSPDLMYNDDPQYLSAWYLETSWESYNHFNVWVGKNQSSNKYRVRAVRRF
jgi:hypothetical protein